MSPWAVVSAAPGAAAQHRATSAAQTADSAQGRLRPRRRRGRVAAAPGGAAGPGGTEGGCRRGALPPTSAASISGGIVHTDSLRGLPYSVDDAVYGLQSAAVLRVCWLG